LKKIRIKASSIYFKNLKEPLGFMKEPADLWVGIFTVFMKIGSHGYTVERSMVTSKQTPILQTSLTMASPGPPLVMLNNLQQGSVHFCHFTGGFDL
jgi:hypothetical protein